MNRTGAGAGSRVLAVVGLTLERNRRPVVRGLDWEASRGFIRWVVGENGSGKSTLLGALAGRVRAAAGTVEYPWGASVGAGDIVRYHPAMEPPPEARVRDWCRLVDALVPPGAGPSVAPELPGRQRLGDLSTGERKRLVLEALLRRPAGLYLLDEPFEHLSPEAKRLLTLRMEAAARDAVVVVATNQGAAAELGPGSAGEVLRLLGEGTWSREGGA